MYMDGGESRRFLCRGECDQPVAEQRAQAVGWDHGVGLQFGISPGWIVQGERNGRAVPPLEAGDQREMAAVAPRLRVALAKLRRHRGHDQRAVQNFVTHA